MSYTFYKVLHLTAIFTIFLSLGGVAARSILGDSNARLKKLVGMLNGIGLVLALVAGFGLMARLGLSFDGWLIIKLVIWLAFGGLLAVMNRKPDSALVLIFVAIAMGAVAAYLGMVKPF